MPRKYTEAQLDFLRTHTNIKRTDLLLMFNKRFNTAITMRNITDLCVYYKIKSTYKFNTPERMAFIYHHAYTDIGVLVKLFNAKFSATYTKSALAHLRQRMGIRQDSNGRFKKGDSAWNKGTKGVCKPNSKSFKKHNKPVNTKEIGYERVDSDGYILLRVANGTGNIGSNKAFIYKHKFLYQKYHNIKLKAGDVIKFKDANKANFKIDNLILITRAHLARLNQNDYDNCPPSIKPVLFNHCMLQDKAGQLKA